MNYKRGRYSWFINPILILLDLLIVTLTILFFDFFSSKFNFTYNVFPKLPKDYIFIIYNIFTWLILSYVTKFYNVYRFTKEYKIISVTIKQSFFYGILLLTYFGFLKIEMSRKMIGLYIIIIFSLIIVLKLLVYYSLKKYRSYFDGNNRSVVIIGELESTKELIQFFKSQKDLGYKVKGIFSNNTTKNTTGNINQSIDFIQKNDIDEIYCSLDYLEESQINKLIDISKTNHLIIKFLPKKNTIPLENVSTDFYGIQPVYSLKQASLNNAFNQFLKRSFDIVFSFIVIVTILSWLIPLMFILIKLESKGPLFYRHIRYGLNYKEFNCLKFRSLKKTTKDVLNQVRKSDDRVTKIGAFIRKTSIDELPQFINIFIGDMSVVGPRPHMIPYSHSYAKHFDKYKYIYRHSVKPGITGLSQTKGYRGEVKKDSDIINRVNFDIFYIENWNFLLDIKIILQTILNIFKGDKNAY